MARGPSIRQLAVVCVALGAITSAGAAVSLAQSGASLSVENQDAQPATEIDSCTTITEPGRYVLTRDLQEPNGTCIEIRASDVTLEGNDHTIRGGQTEATREAFTNASLAPGELLEAADGANETAFAEAIADYPTPASPRWANVGVAANASRPLSNVTVTDLRVTDLFFGIYYENVTDGTIRSVAARNNGDGLEIYNSSDLSVTRTRLSGNEWGAFVLNASNVTVRGVAANDNSVAGVNFAVVRDAAVTDVSTRNNGGVGLVLDFVTDTTVADVNSSRNGYLGIVLVHSNDSVIRNATVSGTLGETELPRIFPEPAGIGLDNATGIEIRDTTATNNRNWTFYSYNNSSATVDGVAVDGTAVSFESRDVALGVQEFVVSRDGQSDAMQLKDRFVLTNTSRNSSIDLAVSWDGGNESRSGDEPETTTANDSRMDGRHSDRATGRSSKGAQA